MMARVRETLGRPLMVSWAVLWGVVVFAAGMIGALIRISYIVGAWQTATDTGLSDLRKITAALALEQAAGRVRGDSRQAQISAHEVAIGSLRTALDTQTELLTEIRGDVKRLMERRFGAADPGPVWSSPGILNQRAEAP